MFNSPNLFRKTRALLLALSRAADSAPLLWATLGVLPFGWRLGRSVRLGRNGG